MDFFSGLLISGGLAALVVIVFFKLLRIVPEQQAWVIEFFGKFQKTLGPGFHMVLPGIQRVVDKHELKEEVIDVPPQICITRDNVQVTVDGILYLKVMDPEKASYGIDNYRYAAAQLAQSNMRSEIGKLELDRTFSEREIMNNAIVKAVDEASDPWGIKVTRYEIKDITPENPIIDAMEAQVRAEREKRAEILESEGVKQSRINVSQGDKSESINKSQGDRQKKINEAQGRAEAITIVADATAQGLQEIAKAIKEPNGEKAVNLRLTNQFVQQLEEILSDAHVSVMPHDLAQIQSVISSVLPGKSGGSQGGAA
ncbi:SPFH domain-containing protein [Salinispira pacifica]|uniref:Putative membrane protease subunit n=1 Tax=Salinispira pacifica TaxID=1307761 RepID=V5WLJ5_9SPIO|nr:stomatin-like protein [Salinispira pacifica]AHC16822.1 Putative membrane protease subunit [Salinispira pacifica]